MHPTDVTSRPSFEADALPERPSRRCTTSRVDAADPAASGSGRARDARPPTLHADRGRSRPTVAADPHSRTLPAEAAFPHDARAPGPHAARGKSAAEGSILFTTFDSPVGPLLLAAHDGGVCLVEFHESKHRVVRGADWREGDHPLLERLRVQLHEYFTGTRRAFDLPLAPRGTTFQREVWHALAAIPYGRTESYAQLAARVGRPSATRAVGAANGRNPLPIVLPCHRVIGANGALTGFGGGLPTKAFLLRLEGATAPALLA